MSMAWSSHPFLSQIQSGSGAAALAIAVMPCPVGYSASREPTGLLAEYLGVLGVEKLAERGVGACAVDGGRTAVHQKGHTDGLCGLLLARAGLRRRTCVRGDASVTPMNHADRERDQLLGQRVELAGDRRSPTHLRETFVHLGDTLPKRCVLGVQVGEDLMVALISHGSDIP